MHHDKKCLHFTIIYVLRFTNFSKTFGYEEIQRRANIKISFESHMNRSKQKLHITAIFLVWVLQRICWTYNIIFSVRKILYSCKKYLLFGIQISVFINKKRLGIKIIKNVRNLQLVRNYFERTCFVIITYVWE